jgi:hypothetical protein
LSIPNTGQNLVPRLRHLATLPGFFSETEATRLLLNQHFTDLPKSLNEIRAIWEKSASKCDQLPERLNPSPYLHASLELDKYEQKIKAWPVYQRAMRAGDFHLVLVRIDELITAQWYLDLNYCSNLVNKVPTPNTSSIADLLDFLYPEKSTWARPTYDRMSGCRALNIPEITPNIAAHFTDIRSRQNEPDRWKCYDLLVVSSHESG